ncbi:hypothetical protein F4778DRAFT_786624 [Xylariomycetidae sp. FL2044]|nr:hypothetical protein F4778DRAFT_786624 [Xylariomycetidae sp. FL2044]
MQFHLLTATILGSSLALAGPASVVKRGGRAGSSLTWCQNRAVTACEHWDDVGVVAKANCQSAEISNCMSENAAEGQEVVIKRAIKPSELPDHLPEHPEDDFKIDVQFGDSDDTILSLPLHHG